MSNEFGKWDEGHVITEYDLEKIGYLIELGKDALPWWKFWKKYECDIRLDQIDDLLLWLDAGKPTFIQKVAIKIERPGEEDDEI